MLTVGASVWDANPQLADFNQGRSRYGARTLGTFDLCAGYVLGGLAPVLTGIESVERKCGLLVAVKPGGKFNFQVPPQAKGKFYVPYDDIPAPIRVELEDELVENGLLRKKSREIVRDLEGNEIIDYQRRRVIEDLYGAHLAGGTK